MACLDKFYLYACIIFYSYPAAYLFSEETILQKIQHSAVTPRACSEWATERSAFVMQKAKNAPGDYDIEFIGDSITEFWEREGAQVWKEFYGHRKAINLGVKADRTQHLLWRLQKGQLDGIYAKVAIVLIGTNNSKGSDNCEAEIVDGVFKVVQAIQQRQPHTKTLLLGIFPQGQTFNARREKIFRVNQGLAKLANDKTIFYLDISSQFMDKNGFISSLIMPDETHLSETGYRIWATVMEPKLQQLLGD